MSNAMFTFYFTKCTMYAIHKPCCVLKLCPLFAKKLFFIKKWANPGLFFVYFWSFQANIITIFTTNICEKMSIQYTVQGFEPTTFGT